MPKEEKDAIERLKKELYSRSQPHSVGNDVRASLSSFETDIPRVWKEPEVLPEETPLVPPLAQFMEKPKKHTSAATKFFLVSSFFFIATIAAAAYFFLGGGNLISSRNIDLQVLAPSLVESGKPETLQVIINNRNKTPLTLAKLIVNYPDGTRSAVDPTLALQHDTQSIDTVPAGGQIKTSLNAIFYGQQGTQENVTLTLEYSIPNSSSVYTKQAAINFVVGSSPVSVKVNAPSEVISGQSFGIDITVQANGTIPIPDVALEAQFPYGFTLATSSLSADKGSSLWRLGELKPGDIQTLHLEGVIQGQDGDQKVFRFLSGSDSSQTDVHISIPLLTIPTTITINKPFVSTSLSLNGQTGSNISISPGSTVQGVITWKNNLATAIKNETLQLSINGAILDKTSIQPSDGGFYQSSNSTIIWEGQEDPSLSIIPPGGSGSVQFSFNTTNPGANLSNRNAVVTLNLAVSGTREDGSSGPSIVSSSAKSQVSIASQVALTTESHYFGAPFSNKGPLPPVSGQTTTYTILWNVLNSSNSLANARVSATLPPYVQFIGSAQNSGISYDTPSRTVTWTLGNVNAGVGYGEPASQGAFQVSFTPSLSQVGSSPTLTSRTTLTAQDRFAQVPLQATAEAPTTQLFRDSSYNPSMGSVTLGR